MSRPAGTSMRTVLGLAFVIGLGDAPPAGADAPIATLDIRPERVRWLPHVDYRRLVLTVSRPDHEVVRLEFEGERLPTFRDAARDGAYSYELTVVPHVDPSVRAALREARETGDMTVVDRLRA